jgi:hypothetical protein
MSGLLIAGDVSGSITLQAPSAAGASVLTLPVTTDTLVGKNTTDTLTNKTFPDGTAAAPSLKFTAGGTQLGLYSADNDYIGIASKGLPVAQIGGWGDGISKNGELILLTFSNNIYGPDLYLWKARGTLEVPLVVQSGDELGAIYFAGYDGAGIVGANVAHINCTVDGTPGIGDMPTALNFYTVPDGSVTGALRMKIDQAGNVIVTGPLGLGYGTGAGGTVTQATSRTTGVTLSKPTGAITMFSAAGSTTAATFTVTNTVIAATDVIILNQKSGTNLYDLMVTAVAAGSFNITFRTTGGTATDAPVINFAIIRGITA